MNDDTHGISRSIDAESWSADAQEDQELPEHLVRLPGQRWAMWRQAGLRGAGFPAILLLKLAAPECAAAADRLLQIEAAAEQARDVFAYALTAALDARLEQTEEGQHEARLGEIRRIRQRMLRRLRQMKLLDPSDLASVDSASGEAFRAAIAGLDAARLDFERAFAVGAAQVSEAINDITSDDRFREAVTWQNRHAFHRCLISLRRTSPDGSHSRKQRVSEELIAKYLQRYCVKNDTIGFFGPIGWARVEPLAEATSARPAPQLLAARTVYFDEWGVEALARRLAENEALLPWLAPRRLPFFRVDQTMLYSPADAAMRLTTQQALVLQACDGARTAREIALDLIRTAANGLASESEVYKVLRYLRDRGSIVWTLEVPMELHPERTLRRLLERVGDQHLRAAALTALDQLDGARAAVARAAGDAAKLDQALGDLEATFTRLTGTSPTRSAGQIYASRTLVYEDCRRDIEVEIGPEVLEALGLPLSLILASARWFTFKVAAIYREAFKQFYTRLAHEAGSPAVPLIDFWLRVQPFLMNEDAQFIDSLVSTFQDRWADILGLPTPERHMAYTSAELQPRVRAAFEVTAPGWRSAPYHSPDVLIAAPSVEAIRRGDYQLVMGELHVGLNTLGASSFLAQHPAREELFLALERDLCGQRLVPVIPRSWPRMTSRTRPVFVLPRDYRLVFARDSPGIPKSRALPIGALAIEDTGSGLVVRTHDGRLSFDLIETFALLLTTIASQAFRILHPRGHTPRVTIDRLVVCREAWHCTAEELPFAAIEQERERFLAARRWARAHQVPRWVFVKVPVEDKPFYVDFDSPVYVNILTSMIRRTSEGSPADSRITIAEMLPGIEQVWLPDAEGQRYTSELRFVVLDLATQDEANEPLPVTR